MIPSVFEYLPDHADKLIVKVAEAAIREEPAPITIAPDALPGVGKPPPHPLIVGIKQELPIGLGIASGALVGGGVPYLIEKKLLGHVAPIPPLLGTAIGSIIGGIAAHRSALADKERDSELARAKQEYQDYLKRRAGNSSNPTVQSPAIRT